MTFNRIYEVKVTFRTVGLQTPLPGYLDREQFRGTVQNTSKFALLHFPGDGQKTPSVFM
jgi:hypothetical protein